MLLSVGAGLATIELKMLASQLTGSTGRIDESERRIVGPRPDAERGHEFPLY